MTCTVHVDPRELDESKPLKVDLVEAAAAAAARQDKEGE